MRPQLGNAASGQAAAPFVRTRVAISRGQELHYEVVDGLAVHGARQRWARDFVWTGMFQVLQRQYGMEPGEEASDTVFVLEFHDQEPKYENWQVGCRFAAGVPPGPAGALRAAVPSARSSGRGRRPAIAAGDPGGSQPAHGRERGVGGGGRWLTWGYTRLDYYDQVVRLSPDRAPENGTRAPSRSAGVRVRPVSPAGPIRFPLQSACPQRPCPLSSASPRQGRSYRGRVCHCPAFSCTSACRQLHSASARIP